MDRNMLGIVKQMNDKEKTCIWQRGLINLSKIRRYGSDIKYSMLNMVLIAGCAENHTKHRNTHTHSVERNSVQVKAGGTYNNHWALNV
jgi:hypothetical protein